MAQWQSPARFPSLPDLLPRRDILDVKDAVKHLIMCLLIDDLPSGRGTATPTASASGHGRRQVVYFVGPVSTHVTWLRDARDCAACGVRRAACEERRRVCVCCVCVVNVKLDHSSKLCMRARTCPSPRNMPCRVFTVQDLTDD